jgi:hypothetical protein
VPARGCSKCCPDRRQPTEGRPGITQWTGPGAGRALGRSV